MSETGPRQRRKADWETKMDRHRELDHDWEAWLEAEATGSEAEAERHLAALFSSLDAAAPSAGFADRVVALALAEVPRRQASWSNARRALAAGLLVAAGIAMALVLPGLLALLARVEWVSLPGLAVSGLAGLASLVARAFGNWQELVEVLRPVARALARPPIVGALAGFAAVASLALASLARAAEREKGARHVPSFG